MPNGHFLKFTISLLIRVILKDGPTYVKKIWEDLSKKIDKLNEDRKTEFWQSPTYPWIKRKPKLFSKPSYASTRKMIYNLKRLGLIEFVKEESVEGKPYLQPRRYYGLVDTVINSVKWLNPNDALYNPDKFKKQREFRKIHIGPVKWMQRIRVKKATSL